MGLKFFPNSPNLLRWDSFGNRTTSKISLSEWLHFLRDFHILTNATVTSSSKHLLVAFFLIIIQNFQLVFNHLSSTTRLIPILLDINSLSAKTLVEPDMVAHTLSPSFWETKEDYPRLKLVWSTQKDCLKTDSLLLRPSWCVDLIPASHFASDSNSQHFCFPGCLPVSLRASQGAFWYPCLFRFRTLYLI